MLADIILKQIEISLFSFENTLKWCLPFEDKYSFSLSMLGFDVLYGIPYYF
jgi:hypothetical protein